MWKIPPTPTQLWECKESGAQRRADTSRQGRRRCGSTGRPGGEAEEEEGEGQKEAQSEEMRWRGFKEALQRQQEVEGGGCGLVSVFDAWPPCHPTVHRLSRSAQPLSLKSPDKAARREEKDLPSCLRGLSPSFLRRLRLNPSNYSRGAKSSDCRNLDPWKKKATELITGQGYFHSNTSSEDCGCEGHFTDEASTTNILRLRNPKPFV